jgi:tetratricopeptide (TPR) repeat protein
MNSVKYIGMDVHKEAISIAVLNSSGKLVMDCVIETKASTILQFFHDMAQREGPERGLEEIRAIVNSDRLAEYPFYHAALGEFEFRAGKHDIAREHFRRALALARNPMERQFFEQRTDACECRAKQRV